MSLRSSGSVSLSREAPSLSREIYTSPSLEMLALGPADSDETPRHSMDLERVCSWRPPSPRKTIKKCRPVSSKRMLGLPRNDSLVESKVRVGVLSNAESSNEIPTEPWVVVVISVALCFSGLLTARLVMDVFCRCL